MKDFDFTTETNEFLITWYLTYGEGFGPTFSDTMPVQLLNAYKPDGCTATFHLVSWGVMHRIVGTELTDDVSRLTPKAVEYVKKLMQERIGEKDGD